jgi:sulfatase maturation enzyme AslB (radical SAM superfamily)
MVEHQRFDLGFSFVTNGTIFDLELMTKLKKFRQVGIEVSIETVDQHNSYVRQGTDTDQVISNIGKFQQWANGSNITVTLRSAISALTIGYFVSLLQFALDKQLIIKSLLVINPKFLDVAILPDHVKQVYKKPYLELLDQLDNIDVRPDFNASDPHNYAMVVKEHCEMCVNLLSVSQPSNVQSLLDDLVPALGPSIST